MRQRVIEAVPRTVGFTSTAGGPYAHRVTATGEGTFRVIAMELLSPRPTRPPHRTRLPGSVFEQVLENPRGYRIVLGSGESTGPFTRRAGTALFAITSSRIREVVEGKHSHLWDVEPGVFRSFDRAETVSLTNESSTRIELVEIEVFRE